MPRKEQIKVDVPMPSLANGDGTVDNGGDAYGAEIHGAVTTPPPLWPEDATASEARLHIAYSNLPRRSKDKLVETLEGWLRWHHKLAAMPLAAAERLLGGSLEYSAGVFASIGAFVDRPASDDSAQLAASDRRTFNLQYELDGGVPRYDRALDAPLSDTAALTPDGAVKREMSLGRARGAQRCFNCGSYNHAMSECPQPRDAEAISAGLAGMRAAGLVDGERPPSRYFLAGDGGGRSGGRQSPDEAAEGAAPGQLGPELREALRLGPLDPPPWLQRMRQLGVPPAYQAGATQSSPTAAAGQADADADELFVVFDDEEAESMWNSSKGLRRAKAGLPKPDAPAAVAVDAANGHLPAPGDSAHDQGAATQQQQPSMAVGTADPAAQSALDPEPVGIPGLEETADDLVLGNVVGMTALPAAGTAAQDEAAPDAIVDAVAFPGVNAPIPEGADPARWGSAGEGTAHDVHGTARRRHAATGGSSAATGRGVKRGFDAANVADWTAVQQRYDGYEHGAADMERQQYHYRVREPDPAPVPPQPPMFAAKLAPLPHAPHYLPQQQNGQISAYPHFASGHGSDPQHQHHHNGHIAGQPGPLTQPASAGHAAHGMQTAYHQQASYPPANAAGMPTAGSAAVHAWQQTPQWPAQPAYTAYRTPPGSWQ